MTANELHRQVVELRKTRTYEAIGEMLGISRAMVKYIEAHPGYRPSAEMKEKLHLDPSPSLAYTRSRNAALDDLARERGYSSWSAVGTAALKDAAIVKRK